MSDSTRDGIDGLLDALTFNEPVSTKRNEMNLYEVQDDDRPFYVVALSWQDALKKWQEKIIEENPDEDWEGDDPDPQPEGIRLMTSGCVELLVDSDVDRQKTIDKQGELLRGIRALVGYSGNVYDLPHAVKQRLKHLELEIESLKGSARASEEPSFVETRELVEHQARILRRIRQQVDFDGEAVELPAAVRQHIAKLEQRIRSLSESREP